MVEYHAELKVAEQYLKEMLEADRDGDYRAFVSRFENIDPEEFNESTFLNDVELMKEELGAFKVNRHQFSRHFPAVLGDAFHTLPVTAFH